MWEEDVGRGVGGGVGGENLVENGLMRGKSCIVENLTENLAGGVGERDVGGGCGRGCG